MATLRAYFIDPFGERTPVPSLPPSGAGTEAYLLLDPRGEPVPLRNWVVRQELERAVDTTNFESPFTVAPYTFVALTRFSGNAEVPDPEPATRRVLASGLACHVALSLQHTVVVIPVIVTAVVTSSSFVALYFRSSGSPETFAHDATHPLRFRQAVPPTGLPPAEEVRTETTTAPPQQDVGPNLTSVPLRRPATIRLPPELLADATASQAVQHAVREQTLREMDRRFFERYLEADYTRSFVMDPIQAVIPRTPATPPSPPPTYEERLRQVELALRAGAMTVAEARRVLQYEPYSEPVPPPRRNPAPPPQRPPAPKKSAGRRRLTPAAGFAGFGD